MNFGTKGDDLVATFEIGDNFTINAEFGNVEGVDFYLIYYSKPLHTVKKYFSYKWVTNFVVGNK
jgi:hypothetical protein